MVVIEECRITPDGKQLIIQASVENLDYYNDVYIDSVLVETNNEFNYTGLPSNNAKLVKRFVYQQPLVSTRCDCNNIEDESKDEDSILDNTETTPTTPLNPAKVTLSDCNCNGIYTSEKQGTKRFRTVVSPKDLGLSSFNDNIFFIYIQAIGLPKSTTPCTMDNTTTMGIAVNLRPIYNLAMKYIKELDNTCSVPRGFIDMILRLKAFNIALKTGNYETTFKYWNKLFKQKINVSPNKGCGCNGIN